MRAESSVRADVVAMSVEDTDSQLEIPKYLKSRSAFLESIVATRAAERAYRLARARGEIAPDNEVAARSPTPELLVQ